MHTNVPPRKLRVMLLSVDVSASVLSSTSAAVASAAVASGKSATYVSLNFSFATSNFQSVVSMSVALSHAPFVHLKNSL